MKEREESLFDVILPRFFNLIFFLYLRIFKKGKVKMKYPGEKKKKKKSFREIIFS